MVLLLSMSSKAGGMTERPAGTAMQQHGGGRDRHRSGTGVRGRPGRIVAARWVFRMRDDRPLKQVRLAWADASRPRAHWPRSPALVRRSAAAGGAPAGAGTVLGAAGSSGAPGACLNVCNAHCSRVVATRRPRQLCTAASQLLARSPPPPEWRGERTASWGAQGSAGVRGERPLLLSRPGVQLVQQLAGSALWGVSCRARLPSSRAPPAPPHGRGAVHGWCHQFINAFSTVIHTSFLLG
jgi:hypothetical protein